MALKIDIVRQREGFYVVSLAGRLDSLTVAAAEAHLQPLLAGAAQLLLLDLAALDYISSMGLRLILKARKDLTARQGQLVMANLQPQIAQVFEVVKALPPQNVFASVAEADRYFDVIQRRAREKPG